MERAEIIKLWSPSSARVETNPTISYLADEFIKEWYAGEGGGGKPSTLNWYKACLFGNKGFATCLGHLVAESVTERDVRNWLAMGNRSKSTLRTYASVVKILYNWAIKRKLIDDNPVAGLRVPRIESRKPIGKENFDTLVTFAEISLKRILKGLYYTGARPTEMCNLKFSDIEDGIITITEHKTARFGNSRVIPICEKMKELLAECEEERTETQEIVFLNTRGNAWTANGLRTRIYRLKKKLNLPDHVCAYSIRHQFGADCVRAGMNLAVIAELMGHTELDTTRGYAHAGDKDNLKAAIQIVR